MRFLILFFLIHINILADKDGNGKCWQREKIEELHYITKSTKHVEYGSIVADKKGDYSDYYYFTPKVASKFTLIFSSSHPASLQIGTSCKDTSILNEKHDNTFVVLDENIEETIYIHVIAESEKSTSYEIHVTVTLNDDKEPQTNYNTQYGSHFDCQIIDGNITCKR